MINGKFICAAALTCVTFAATSDARTIGGYSGNPSQPNTVPLGCFFEAFGAVRGICNQINGQNYGWIVPMLTDTSGNKTVTLTGSAGSLTLTCTPFALNQTETLFTAGNQVQWANTEPAARVSTGANVPVRGYLYTFCTFQGPGAQLDSVDWNV